MTRSILPNTGAGIVIWIMGLIGVLAGMATLISGPVAQRIKGFTS